MGLGDLTEKLINVITLGYGKKLALYIAKLRGKKDCGCKKRKDVLNTYTPVIFITKDNKKLNNNK